MPQTEFPYDVFLSHNSKDKPKVRRLAKRLKAAGVRVWLDEWVIQAGDIIALKVDEGLEQSRVLLLCISPAALASGWVALERSTAVHRDPANEGRRFIPLLLGDCALPDTLRRYKYLDFREESDGAFAEVLAACRTEALAVPPEPPVTPKKGSANPKPKPVKPPEQAEPLAVLERKLTGHKNWVNSVAVSPDGTWAASGSDDKTVKIWNLETGLCQATLKGHTKEVRSVAITPDGKRILSGSFDNSVRVWGAMEFEHQTTLNLDGFALSISPLPDNERVLIGLSSPKNIIELWSLSRGSLLWGKRTNGYANCVAIDKKAKLAISGHHGNNNDILLWNLETGQCLATLKGHSDIVKSVQITPDGRFAVSGSKDKTVKLWDLEAGTCVGTLEGHQNNVDSVAISPDGTLIASTGWHDRTVRLWDWKSGTCLLVINNEDNWTPISIAFSPVSSRLVVGTTQNTIYVYCLTGIPAAPPAEPTRRYINAKVVLLGEGTVGKTSLAHRLIEDKYVVKDRTHGMNVWPLNLPLPADATADREALLWDLAGQEDYRLIHRLFLDETALALLLINPQKDDPFAEAGDWLKALDTASSNDGANRRAARLAIFSQVDVGEPKLGKKSWIVFASSTVLPTG